MIALRRLAPLLLQETDSERLRLIVRRVGIANAVVLAIWAPVVAIVWERPRSAWLGVFAALGLFGLATLARRWPVAAGAGISAWIWLMGLASQVAAGGLPATTTGTYMIAIASGGLLLGVVPAIGMAALSAVVSGAVAWAGERGMLSALLPPASHTSLWWFSLTALVALPVLLAESLTRLRATLRQAEEAERRYRLVAENSRDVIWLIQDGALRYVSPASERLFGWTPAEQIARAGPWGFLTADSAQLVSASFGRAVAAGAEHLRYEAEHLRKDGSTVWCEVEVSLLRGPDGALLGVLGVTRDMSERRRAEQERQRLDRELVQAQKMEIVGRVAAGVAHDLNNQLTVLLAGIEAMSDPSPTLREAAQKDMAIAAEGAAALTRQLHLFSRTGSATPSHFDLNQLVRRMERVLPRVLGVDVGVRITPSAEPAVVHADESRIEQAVLNLSINARDAMPGGGQLGIAVGAVGSDRGSWRLSVSDTGTGIDEAARPHIFEAFFTTKPPGRGTGLGLAMVQRVAEDAGGRVSFETEVGRGTTFHIDLPRAVEPAAVSPALARRAAAAARQSTVLVVDDSAEVRRLLARAIAEEGCRVLDAPSAAHAIALANDAAPDLLVTDVAMPGMRGPELAAALRRERPALRVLYVTAYAEEEFDFAADPLTSVLWKPFPMKALRSAVRRALEPEVAARSS